MHVVRKLLEIKAQQSDTVATVARAAMMVEVIVFVGI